MTKKCNESSLLRVLRMLLETLEQERIKQKVVTEVDGGVRALLDEIMVAAPWKSHKGLRASDRACWEELFGEGGVFPNGTMPEENHAKLSSSRDLMAAKLAIYTAKAAQNKLSFEHLKAIVYAESLEAKPPDNEGAVMLVGERADGSFIIQQADRSRVSVSAGQLQGNPKIGDTLEWSAGESVWRPVG